MDKSPANVLKLLLKDYETLALDPSTSSLTQTKLLKEIDAYRQLLDSVKTSDDHLYKAIPDIYESIQQEVDSSNLSSKLMDKRGDVFSRINKAAGFYVAAKGPFTYKIGKRIFRFPELIL